MIPRLRKFFDIRSGEGLPVLLSFLYIAVVVAAFLLAKPIRSSLFLSEYGPYALVYAYAAVPIALALFVPIYTRIVARFGSRAVTAGTLLFFAANVAAFWYLFQFRPFWPLHGIFYVWVNCFGVIAPVQAWSFANSLFDTRQAKRLFGPIGAGASLGAIAGGAMARFLVEPMGGTVNMMLVLGGLIVLAAGLVLFANARVRRAPGGGRRVQPPKHPFVESLRDISRSRYLKLMAAMVFLVAIATQWIAFQLSFVADQRFGTDRTALTEFFGTFNLAMGVVSFTLQLLITGPALRRFGLSATILLLPLALATGSLMILLVPMFWAVLFTSASDQAFRFSLDKATYELLYLPIPRPARVAVKNTIDIVVSRFADAAGAVVLGVATGGFFMLPGMGLELRGTAAINLFIILTWAAIAWRLRVEYVRTIEASIHRHRIDSERLPAGGLDRSAADAVGSHLRGEDPEDVRHALDVLESQNARQCWPALRSLLSHEAPDIRRRALALLDAGGDDSVATRAAALLRDADIGVRTAALLYLSRHTGSDPLRLIEELGDFEDFSIRAGMAAFLASPGPSHNPDAARAILEAMTSSEGAGGASDRKEAARLLRVVPERFDDLLAQLVRDPDAAVAREAIASAGETPGDELVEPLLSALGRAEISDDAADALARFGDDMVSELAARLEDERTPIEIRRELPGVLVRIGSAAARQVLIDSLLQADVTLRHRVIASLNKIQIAHPDRLVDRDLIELLLAAEIAGHYRSYQVMGPLRAQLKEEDAVLQALLHSMEQELERIFRLMALLYPRVALHDAYVGVRSTNPIVRANALEFLDNVLRPEHRQILVPILDSQVTVDERIALANRFVGAPLETPEQAVATLLASEDPWLRSCAVYAVGALQIHSLHSDLLKVDTSSDAVLRDNVETALQRLKGDAEAAPHAPAPGDMSIGV
jgi:AAA family ATP:ADP antiporter